MRRKILSFHHLDNVFIYNLTSFHTNGLCSFPHLLFSSLSSPLLYIFQQIKLCESTLCRCADRENCLTLLHYADTLYLDGLYTVCVSLIFRYVPDIATDGGGLVFQDTEVLCDCKFPNLPPKTVFTFCHTFCSHQRYLHRVH